MYGPAVRCKRFSSSWHSAVLHQCIRSLLGAVLLRTIMDISARAVSLSDRPQWASWVTSVRMRREDRSSISSYPLADLGGEREGLGLRHRFSFQSFLRSGGLGGGRGEFARLEASSVRNNGSCNAGPFGCL